MKLKGKTEYSNTDEKLQTSMDEIRLLEEVEKIRNLDDRGKRKK